MKTQKEKHCTPLEQTSRICVLFQCFAFGSWLTLLLIKFLLDFPFSSEIGTCAIYVTAVFVAAAMGAIEGWYRKLTQLQPETTSIKDAVEVAHHIYLVLTALAVLAVGLLLTAMIMIAFFHVKTTSAPVERYFTNWPLYALSLCWLGHLAYFGYDLVTMRLWKNVQAVEDIEA